MQFLPRNCAGRRTTAASTISIAMIGFPIIATGAFLIGDDTCNSNTALVGGPSSSTISSTRLRHQRHPIHHPHHFPCQRFFKTSSTETATTRCSSSNNNQNYNTALLASSSSSSSSSSTFDDDVVIRTRQTSVDYYYQKHGTFLGPKVPHMILPVNINNNNNRKNGVKKSKAAAAPPPPTTTTTTTTRNTSCDDGSNNINGTTTTTQKNKNNINKILVIGDVHGCYDEMLEIHDKAVKENNDHPFEYVILVGDMCNKGPESAKVVRFVRKQPNWFSVRGNHDDKALLAALGCKERAQKKKYNWITQKGLSDDDVSWLSELPYTITIPGGYLNDDEDDADTLIVHAGLIPNKPLKKQLVDTMITLRNALPMIEKRNQQQQNQPSNNKDFNNDDDGSTSSLQPTKYIHFGGRIKKQQQQKIENDDDDDDAVAARSSTTTNNNKPIPWASAWKGPQKIIFGHDARRGLQKYDGNWALGLDTGAVYGNGMTAVLLPERKIVSIETKVYQSTGD